MDQDVPPLPYLIYIKGGGGGGGEAVNLEKGEDGWRVKLQQSSGQIVDTKGDPDPHPTPHTDLLGDDQIHTLTQTQTTRHLWHSPGMRGCALTRRGGGIIDNGVGHSQHQSGYK